MTLDLIEPWRMILYCVPPVTSSALTFKKEELQYYNIIRILDLEYKYKYSNNNMLELFQSYEHLEKSPKWEEQKGIE